MSGLVAGLSTVSSSLSNIFSRGLLRRREPETVKPTQAQPTMSLQGVGRRGTSAEHDSNFHSGGNRCARVDNVAWVCLV